MAKINDLSGKNFGYLTVLKRLDDKFDSLGRRKIMWDCLCSCGNHKDVTTGKLTSGHVKSCGKCGKFNRIKDLSGLKFDKLTVLSMNGYYSYPNSTNRDYKWLCVCECGNHITVRGNSLKTNANHNCGCYRKAIRLTDDLMVGHKFGEWTVLSRADFKFSSTGTKIHMWNCKCSCGNIDVVQGARLKDGRSYCCSNCNSSSKFEMIVSDYLKSKGFNFSSEVTFSDLVGLNGGYLRYDFMVRFNGTIYLIECHGGQHYKPIDFYGGDDFYKRQVAHDKIKRDYAFKNSYNLLEIDCRNTNYNLIVQQLDKYLN